MILQLLLQLVLLLPLTQFPGYSEWRLLGQNVSGLGVYRRQAR